MTDTGLISVMPALSYVAIGMLLVSFALALRQQPISTPIMLLHVVALIFMLYGLTALVEDQPRFAVTWLHAGFADYVMRNGQVDPALDARFSWPGFFILSAFVTRVAGLQDLISLLNWIPVFFNLIYLPPLVAIFRSMTDDDRLIWLGVWVFFLTNVVGQDYFSPQGLNFFFFLVVIAILLTWFKARTRADYVRYNEVRLIEPHGLRRFTAGVQDWVTSVDPLNATSTPQTRAGLVLVIILLTTAIGSSHQLTPFFLLGGVGLLVVFGRMSRRGLWILMGVIVASWLSYMTVTFLKGHLYILTGDVGQVSGTVNSTVTQRLRGSQGHLLVLYMRLGMTVAIWALAGVGVLRRWRNKRYDLTMGLLAAAPFPFVALQNYGGEMMLRVYLFALPFMAFMIAALVFTTVMHGRSLLTLLVIVGSSVGLLGGFMLVRYGNERMDYVTDDEYAAVEYLYQVAEPGSLLAAAAYNLPWKYQDYEQYRYLTVKDAVLQGDVQSITAQITDKDASQRYFILTRGQLALLELFEGETPQEWSALIENLMSSGHYQVIYRNADAVIFSVISGSGGA